MFDIPFVGLRSYLANPTYELVMVDSLPGYLCPAFFIVGHEWPTYEL